MHRDVNAARWPRGRRANTISSEYVGDDFDADMAKMAADPKTQEWWSVCEPMQEPVPEASEGEWWHAIPEVFHTD